MPFCILYIFVQNLCALLFLWHAPISPHVPYTCIRTHISYAPRPVRWRKCYPCSKGILMPAWGWVAVALRMGMGLELDWSRVVGWLFWHFSANYGTCGDVGIMPDPFAFDMAYQACTNPLTHTHTQASVFLCKSISIHIYMYIYICLESYLSPSMLPLKPLMWQAHDIKIKWWKGKRRGKFERESGKSSHNEHFPLPYLRYFIIIFLRRSCRSERFPYKMAGWLGLFSRWLCLLDFILSRFDF